MFKPVAALAVVATIVLTFAACGGGGGSSGPEITRPADTLPPKETVRDQLAREPAILQRLDSLIVSTMYGETNLQDLPSFSARSSCTGTSCTLREPTSGLSVSISKADLGGVSDNEALLTKNDITVITGKSSVGDLAGFSWGAWMEHSGFAVEDVEGTVNVDGSNVHISVRAAIAGGDLTRSVPTGTATWKGIIVGTPATGARLGNSLIGDAALMFDLGRHSLSASFTEIVDMTRNAAPHSVRSVQFDNVPVSSSGEYRAGNFGNRIQGGFYGPNHAETAGVFEQSNIVGAFGAKRQ